MGTRTVKNYPSPRLMQNIGATNQTVPEAIGELVANCFDARINNTAINILVEIRDGHISVIDDGKGMEDSILEKAVCIAEDMSKYIERGEGAKGHFGMGFKAACSTLGGFYEIYTRPINGAVEYHVAFDIEDYSRRPSGADSWDIEIEDSAFMLDGPLGKSAHGTAFVICRLKDDNPSVGAVLRYLGTAFKGHLKSGDRITLVDGKSSYSVEPTEYRYIDGTRASIDTTCGVNDMYHVTGWMALSDQTHNDGLYGFNIYRNNQVLVTWDKSWFKPHLMTSRIMGEVNLDFIDATFYKQGMQKTEAWKIVSAHMTEYLKPLVKASRSISRAGNIKKPAAVRTIVSTLRSELGEAPLSDPGLNAEAASQATAQVVEDSRRQSAGVNDNIKNVVREASLIIEGVGEIKITLVEKEHGGNVTTPFDYIFEEADAEDEPSELQVIVFADHPLWSKKVDSEVVAILATSDAIYRMLVEKLDMDTYKAHRLRSSWISNRIEVGAQKHE